MKEFFKKLFWIEIKVPKILEYFEEVPRRLSWGNYTRLSKTYWEWSYTSEWEIFVLFKDTKNHKEWYTEYKVDDCKWGGDMLYWPYWIWLTKIRDLNIKEHEEKYWDMIKGACCNALI